MKIVIAVMWSSLTAITYGFGFESVLPTAQSAMWHIPESGLLALLGVSMIALAQRARRNVSS